MENGWHQGKSRSKKKKKERIPIIKKRGGVLKKVSVVQVERSAGLRQIFRVNKFQKASLSD